MHYPGLTISVVEDHADLRRLISIQLESAGFKVNTFENANQFYRFLAFQERTIAILDIGLNGEDGLSICRYLRSKDPMMGIVFVTGRNTREDRLTGLTAGADAYLTKPVDMEELVLKVKRLALRLASKPSSAGPARAEQPGAWSMGADAAFTVAPNGVRVRLSVNETQLMHVLWTPPGRACSHAELGAALGLLAEEVDKHRIEVILHRLRTKVERSAGMTLPVKSCRGFGYRLDLGNSALEPAMS